jgi:hypothetical protein
MHTPERRQQHLISRHRHARTSRARSCQVEPYFVAVESNEVKITSIDLDKRRKHLATDS